MSEPINIAFSFNSVGPQVFSQNENNGLILELQQRVQLLEKERSEMQEREERLKSINDQIMEAFSSLEPTSGGCTSEEIKMLESRYKKELEVASEEFNELKKKLCTEKEESTIKIEELQSENWRYKAQIETISDDIERCNFSLEDERQKNQILNKNLEQANRLREEEKIRMERKLKDFERQAEKDKKDSDNKVKEVLREMEENLDGIKILHEHEKSLLKTKVSGLLNEKSIVVNACEQNQDLYSSLRAQMNYERQEFEKKLDQMRDIAEELENEKLKSINQEDKIERLQIEMKLKESSHEEEKRKLREKTRDLWLEIKKLEQIQKNLQAKVKDRETVAEDQKKDFLRRLNLEKLKSENLIEAANKIKEEYTKRNAFLIQEILSKEEQVKKLQKDNYRQELAFSKASHISQQQQSQQQQQQFQQNRQNHFSTSLWGDQSLQQSTPLREKGRSISNKKEIKNRSNSNRTNNSISTNLQNKIQFDGNSLLNPEFAPDLSLFTNNLPSVVNDQAFLQDFAQAFGNSSILIESKRINNASLSNNSQQLAPQDQKQYSYQEAYLNNSKRESKELNTFGYDSTKQKSMIKERTVSAINSRKVSEICNTSFTLNKTEIDENPTSNKSSNQIVEMPLSESQQPQSQSQSQLRRQNNMTSLQLQNIPRELKENTLNKIKKRTITDKSILDKNLDYSSSNKLLQTPSQNYSVLRSPLTSRKEQTGSSKSPCDRKKNQLSIHYPKYTKQPQQQKGSCASTLFTRSRAPTQASIPTNIINENSPDSRRKSVILQQQGACNKKNQSVSYQINSSIISYVNEEQEPQFDLNSQASFSKGRQNQVSIIQFPNTSNSVDPNQVKQTIINLNSNSKQDLNILKPVNSATVSLQLSPDNFKSTGNPYSQNYSAKSEKVSHGLNKLSKQTDFLFCINYLLNSIKEKRDRGIQFNESDQILLQAQIESQKNQFLNEEQQLILCAINNMKNDKGQGLFDALQNVKVRLTADGRRASHLSIQNQQPKEYESKYLDQQNNQILNTPKPFSYLPNNFPQQILTPQQTYSQNVSNPTMQNPNTQLANLTTQISHNNTFSSFFNTPDTSNNFKDNINPFEAQFFQAASNQQSKLELNDSQNNKLKVPNCLISNNANLKNNLFNQSHISYQSNTITPLSQRNPNNFQNNQRAFDYSNNVQIYHSNQSSSTSPASGSLIRSSTPNKTQIQKIEAKIIQQVKPQHFLSVQPSTYASTVDNNNAFSSAQEVSATDNCLTLNTLPNEQEGQNSSITTTKTPDALKIFQNPNNMKTINGSSMISNLPTIRNIQLY